MKLRRDGEQSCQPNALLGLRGKKHLGVEGARDPLGKRNSTAADPRMVLPAVEVAQARVPPREDVLTHLLPPSSKEYLTGRPRNEKEKGLQPWLASGSPQLTGRNT